MVRIQTNMLVPKEIFSKALTHAKESKESSIFYADCKSQLLKENTIIKFSRFYFIWFTFITRQIHSTEEFLTQKRVNVGPHDKLFLR